MSGLATVERVVNVEHHPNADKLDIIKVLGYECIVGRDSYKVGDFVVFIQPDSILPTDKAWAAEPLRYTSKARVKSIRLRGSWSMGLVMPVTIVHDNMFEAEEGEDFTELLGVTKYEPPLPSNTQAKGGLPFQIPKTDEDRYQNLRKLDELYGQDVHLTLKIDGQSATYYCVLAGDYPGVEETVVGMTSRSLELRVGQDEEGNQFESNWHKAERRYDILNRLRTYCEKFGVSLALRGEVYGGSIQGLKHNPHTGGEIDFAAYSVYNISDKKYERKDDGFYVRHVAKALDIPLVPLVDATELTEELIAYYDHGTKTVDGKPFEGVVVEHANGSFKIINKWYDAEKE